MGAVRAVALATCASGRRLGDTARCGAVAIVARASGRRHSEIGWIVAVSARLHPAVAVLEVDEAVTVGGGELVGIDTAAGWGRWVGSGGW